MAGCLAGGGFLLLIVGDRVSPNIALLSRAIQSGPGLNYTVGLVEMQLYEMAAGNEWPLIVLPEVVGRTVEKTRGVVQVRYTREKPDVSVEVDDGDSDPSRKLDLEVFLKEIAKDLVRPYREGIEEWGKAGGTICFTKKRMFFEMEFGGRKHRIVRCGADKVNVIQRKAVEQWGGASSLYEGYLGVLEAAPVALEHARSDRMWISYDEIRAADLRVLLKAARELTQQIRSDGL